MKSESAKEGGKRTESLEQRIITKQLVQDLLTVRLALDIEEEVRCK